MSVQHSRTERSPYHKIQEDMEQGDLRRKIHHDYTNLDSDYT